jgi:hypothetical protein
MRTIHILAVVLAFAASTQTKADSVTITGGVADENSKPAPGETVNVVCSPADKAGRNSKGSGITRNPAGDYKAPVAAVSSRVTGLWVTCMNENCVAEPNYVPFTPYSPNGVYTASQLTLMPKKKADFTKAEAKATIGALATTYELHVAAELIQKSEAVKRMSDECWTVLQAINREPASSETIGEIMMDAYKNLGKHLKTTTVFEEYLKLDPRINQRFVLPR